MSRRISLVNELTTVAIYLVAWGALYLITKILHAARFGVKSSPVHLIWRTTRLNNLIESVALKRPEMWRALGNAGIAMGFGLMGFMIYQLVLNLRNLVYRSEQAFSIQPILPIPGIGISFDTFPYLVVALSVAVASHELAHGVASAIERVPLKSTGIFFSPIIMGGFVEPDDEVLEDSPTASKLRVFAAGSFSNAALGIIVLILMANFGSTIAPFYDVSQTGVQIGSTLPGFPAQIAGIQGGDILVSVNGTKVSNLDDLRGIIGKMRPGNFARLGTQRGDFVLELAGDPKNSSRAFMGVSNLVNHVVYLPKLPFLSGQLPFQILRTELWLVIVLTSLALINMLPIPPFDGDKFLDALLKASGVRWTKTLRISANAACAVTLALNFAFSFYRFGFIIF